MWNKQALPKRRLHKRLCRIVAIISKWNETEHFLDCHWLKVVPLKRYFIMPTKSVNDRNFHFNVQICAFEYRRKVKTIRHLYNYIFIVLKIYSVYLFSATLYKLILVLHKDVLFHWKSYEKNYFRNCTTWAIWNVRVNGA